MSTVTQCAEPEKAEARFSIGPLVRGMFAALEQAKVRWAVLRNVEGLPDFTRNDIDLLIARRDLGRARQIIQETALQHGWRVCRVISKYEHLGMVLVGPSPERRFLVIDLLLTCRYRASRFADERFGLERRRKVAEDLWAVPVGFETAVIAVKEIAQHGHLPEKSRGNVCRGATLEPDAFVETIAPYLGRALSLRLLSACQSADWQQLKACTLDVRKALGRWGLSTMFRRVAFLWAETLYYLHPPLSMMVVLVGPDGSGKSTIARALCDRLHDQPFRKCMPMEFNFRILPRLQNLKRLAGRPRPAASAQPALHSGMHADHSALRAMVYVAYYSLDLFLGRALLQRWRGQWGLVVFARYFYDYYYLLGYGRAPRWFLQLMELLIPAPDLLLFLDRDAEQIYLAKPELELAEIRNQQQIIRDLVQGRENAVVIAADEGIEMTVSRVTEVVLNRLLGEG